MPIAEKFVIVSAGTFFLTGLLTGIWKYRQIVASPEARAHPYVDLCHRAALMYAFASILVLKFVEISQLSDTVEIAAVCALMFYFGTSILIYMIYGLLKDTDNLLKPPFRLGNHALPAGLISGHMWLLIVAEVCGFVVLFYGVLIEVLAR